MLTLRLFDQNPDVLTYYQQKFQYIHVDEYQDTNHAQYQLVKLLASRFKNICVVGDADQSIYGWRGADMQNILDFEKDYPDAKVVLLEENYRSTKTILQAANDVIKTIATAVRRISGHKMKTGEEMSITVLMTSRTKRSLLLKPLKSSAAKLATSTVILRFSTGPMLSHGPLKKRYSSPTFPIPW